MDQELLNIALPENLRGFVLEQVAERGYANAGEYVRALIRDDQVRRATQEAERLVLQGLDSGGPREMTQADWDELRRRVAQRASEKQ